MKAELKSYWGSDLIVVNNARVSFHKESQWIYECRSCKRVDSQPEGGCQTGPCMFERTIKEADKRLIGYLARGCTKDEWDILNYEAGGADPEELEAILKHVKRMPEHWAPFANGNGLRFLVKAPIPIMRQMFKSKVGSVESEVSRRYVDDPPEVFYPKFRGRPEGSIKQGSGPELFGFIEAEVVHIYDESIGYALRAYDLLIEKGVCPEQARFVLPQGTYTEAIVSNSLYGWARFYNQRSDRDHAQGEVADIADQIAVEAKRWFPVSWDALTG